MSKESNGIMRLEILLKELKREIGVDDDEEIQCIEINCLYLSNTSFSYTHESFVSVVY